jgi:hypothetical protein
MLLTLAIAAIALNQLAVALWLGIPALLLIVAEIIVIIRSSWQSDLRDVETRAYALATALRDLLEWIPTAVSYSSGPIIGEIRYLTPAELEQAQRARTEMLARHYNSRYAARARQLARDFRRFQVPQTDVFFKLVDAGPQDEHEIFQIAAGLDRLAKQLREPPEHGLCN